MDTCSCNTLYNERQNVFFQTFVVVLLTWLGIVKACKIVIFLPFSTEQKENSIFHDNTNYVWSLLHWMYVVWNFRVCTTATIIIQIQSSSRLNVKQSKNLLLYELDNRVLLWMSVKCLLLMMMLWHSVKWTIACTCRHTYTFHKSALKWKWTSATLAWYITYET